MIKAVGNKNGKPVVLLGLEAQNLSRLREGQPIRVNLKNFGEGQVTELPDIDVFIFFAGQDERQALWEAYNRQNPAGSKRELPSEAFWREDDV